MTTNIKTHIARIETISDLPASKSAFMDIRTDMCGGNSCFIKFYPTWSYVCIITDTEKEEYAAIATIPNPKWETDLLGCAHEKLGGKWEITKRFYEVQND